MEESKIILTEAYDSFVGDGMYVILFFIAILGMFMCLKKEDKKERKIYFIFVIYSIIILILNINPLFTKFITKALGEKETYWRMYWLIPIGFAIAYIFTRIVFIKEKKIEQITVIILSIVIIAISGDLIYCRENYEKVGNYYKIPDCVLEVILSVQADEENYKKIGGPEEFLVYTRQVDGTISICQTRNVLTQYGENSLVTHIINNDYDKIINFCKNKKTNYLILYNDENLNSDYLCNNGFNIFFYNEKYVVFKLGGKNGK